MPFVTEPPHGRRGTMSSKRARIGENQENLVFLRPTEDYEVAKCFISYNMYCGEGGVLVFDRDLIARDFRHLRLTLLPVSGISDKERSGNIWRGSARHTD